MAPFEALYGRKCRTPLFWNQMGETQVFGPDVLRDAEEKVSVAPSFKNKTRYIPYVSSGSQISHIATNKGNIITPCLLHSILV